MDNLDRVWAKATRANSALRLLIRQVENHGVKVINATDGDMDVDAEICLEGDYSIQVESQRSLGLVKQHPDGCCTFYPVRRSIAEVIADLKRVRGA
jgi:hypothetical protein